MSSQRQILSNLHNGDQVAAVNRFDFALGDVTYLSRADSFANYAEATAEPSDFTLDTEVHAHGSWNPEDYNDPSDPVPTTGASGTVKLGDLRGADYDDPRWEELLDQVTVDEMVELIAYGGHQTAAVNPVGKVRTLDTDGPAGMSSPTLSMLGTGYCCNMINGVHSANNYDLCTQAARKEWGFAGIIMTDWTTTMPHGGSTPWKCVAAGNDLIMPGCQGDMDSIAAALKSGELDRELLKGCVARLISIAYQSNQYEDAVSYSAQF